MGQVSCWNPAKIWSNFAPRVSLAPLLDFCDGVQKVYRLHTAFWCTLPDDEDE